MIAHLDRRYWSAKGWIDAHRAVRALGIGPSDLVLDMGSGQRPHPRANVLCDLFVADNTERASGASLRVDRPLVVSDATRTPFPDHTFDFVFCSHLLEHMTDPGALLDELQRIARAGYIETPSKVYEKLHGWHFHRWFVSGDEAGLRIEGKPSAVYDEDLHNWFRSRLHEPDFWRAVIPKLSERGLITTYVWRDRIDYEVIGESDHASDFVSAEKAEVDAGRPSDRETLSQRIRAVIDSRWRHQSDDLVSDVMENLRCPACGARMNLLQGRAVCPHCQHENLILGFR
jgi:SAM-dependent methyltransferase